MRMSAMSPVRALCIAVLSAGCLGPGRWRAVSTDHQLVVEVERRGSLACVTITGRGATCFDGVALDALVFSERSSHVAHPAQVGDRWTVVVDGRAGAMWDAVGKPVFSRDGERIAYPALDGSMWRVVVDGKPGAAFDAVFANSIAFDAVGARLAFAGARNGAAVAVIDGAESEPWDVVGQLAFSASGAHVAYVGQRGGAATLMVDGSAVARGETITHVTFGHAAEAPAYVLRDSTGTYVRESARRFGPYASVTALTMLAGGREIVYVVHDTTGDAVAVNGARGPWHRAVDPPSVSRSGRRWGYVARDSAAAFVFLGDSLVARESWASNLVIASSGGIAYLAQRGNTVAVVDATGTHAEAFIVDGTLQLLRDDSTWTCLAGTKNGRRLFVIAAGSKGRRPFDWVEGVRLIGQGQGTDALRAWVAVEGELLAAAR